MLATPSLDLVLDTHSRFATPRSSNQTQHKHGDKFMQHTHAMPSAMRNERCTHARTRPTDKNAKKATDTTWAHTGTAAIHPKNEAQGLRPSHIYDRRSAKQSRLDLHVYDYHQQHVEANANCWRYGRTKSLLRVRGPQ